MKITPFFASLLLAIGFLSFSSCIDDDGNPVTPVTLCTDVNYLGFRADGQSPGTPIEVVSNATADFSTTSFVANTSFTPSVNTIGNNSAAWDNVGLRMVYIDQWNNSGLWVYNFGSTVTQVSVPTANPITAPEFINGQLYVVEVDYSAQMLLLRPLSIVGTTSVLGTPLHVMTFANFPFNPDTVNNYLYSSSDQSNQLYIMGTEKLLIYDVTTFSATVVGLPTGGRHLDVVWTQDGTLLSVFHSASGSSDLVRLDVSGPTATSATAISGLDVNPESIALVYKECGDRLHIMTHFVFGGSGVTTRFYEVEMNSLGMISRDFPGWIVGIAHRY
ncbi:MAG: hypothetical protein AAF433_02720 [Bacteroidota bacterium]